MTWTDFGVAPAVPAAMTDPEISRAMILTPSSPELPWTNVLADDPVPTSVTGMGFCRPCTESGSMAPSVFASLMAQLGPESVGKNLEPLPLKLEVPPPV
ncbi:MAG: hypothetical protein V3S24_03290 [Candidatus Tectomicrobia bacterium]